mgnify:CR=1 FL=1
MVNLPGVDRPWGKEIRGCLTAPTGYVLCGADMTSLEDTTKRHYMQPYDPDYVHEMSQAGFDTRQMYRAIQDGVSSIILGFNDWAKAWALDNNNLALFPVVPGGERQRVIIAKAVSQDSSIFLMDEPTSDLDLKNQIEIMKKVKKLVSDKSNEKAAVVAIHDINIAARFADVIFLLDEGKIFSQGSPEEVLTEENIKHVFGVTSEIIPKTRKNPMRIFIKDEISPKGKDVN